jgi:tRNA modification GTPase
MQATDPGAPAHDPRSAGVSPDAIVAIATAPGRGAVGIVRASGRNLAPLIQALCGRPLQPRLATLLPFVGSQGETLDRGLAIHFPAPHSYTGEDVLELQAHGGPVLLQLLLARCLQAQPGIRLAEPGEFTQRAFLNDKLDLAQAEAVADLIDASTEAAARSAARSLSGAFSLEVQQLASRMVQLRLLVEATLDFPEEEIDFLEKADARGQLQAIADTVHGALARARQGALLREGLQVVIAGQPNVGKSSLLNALAGAELAIVTPVAGTTRDRVSQTIQIEGVPLHVVDTAGIRQDIQAADEVERIGMRRSWEAIAQADVVLFVHDIERQHDPAYQAHENDLARQIGDALKVGVPLLQVFNKADVLDSPAQNARGETDLLLSTRTGAGLEGLRQAILRAVGWQAAPEGLFTARARHVQALQATLQHVLQAQRHAEQRDAALDLLAEELRLAHQALGSITGEFSTEDLLGAIFSSFCIGK